MINTNYNQDRLQDLGIQLVRKERLLSKRNTRKVMGFANRNDVTNFSTWVGMAFGVLSLLLMVVL